MSARKFVVVAVYVCIALSLPLVAAAQQVTFMNISGAARGNAVATFSSVNPNGTRTNKTVTLTNGILFPARGSAALVFDNVNNTARLNTTVAFTDKKDTLGTGILGGVPVDIYFRAESLLKAGNNLSGACLVELFYPSNDYVATHAGSGRQYSMEGGARMMITGKNDRTGDMGSGMMKATNFTPYWVNYYDYTSDGNGNVTSTRVFNQDGKLTIPPVQFRFESFTTAL